MNGTVIFQIDTTGEIKNLSTRRCYEFIKLDKQTFTNTLKQRSLISISIFKITHKMNISQHIKQVFLPMIKKGFIAILIIYSVSKYFDWPLDWFSGFYIITLLYYFRKVSKFKYEKKDIVVMVVSVFSTSVALLLYWVTIQKFSLMGDLFLQIISFGLFVLVCISLWILPFLFGSNSLRAQIGEKNIWT